MEALAGLDRGCRGNGTRRGESALLGLLSSVWNWSVGGLSDIVVEVDLRCLLWAETGLEFLDRPSCVCVSIARRVVSWRKEKPNERFLPRYQETER